MSSKHESLVKKYGATHVIDRTLSLNQQIEQIRSIAPSLNAAFNTVGSKETDLLAAQSFSSGGRIVSALEVSKDVSEYSNVTGNQIYGSPVAHPESATKAWTHIEEALKTGKFLPLPLKVYGGIEDVAEALKAVKKASGYKVIIHPQE